jgi:hypothetical protein
MAVARPDDINITEKARVAIGPPTATRGDVERFYLGEYGEPVRTRLDRAVPVRRTPRKSLVVVLPENHVLSPDVVAEELAPASEHDPVDVILACAGQPANLGALTRRIRDIQVLLAPSGTSSQELRELGMSQAPGDIVMLLSTAAVPVAMGEPQTSST